MKRPLYLLMLSCLLMTASPLCAQDEDSNNTLTINLNTLQSDLTKLSSVLITYEDIETYDYDYQEMGNRLRSFAALVPNDSPLYETYSDCNMMYYQLQKRIEDLQEEHGNKENYNALMNMLQNSITELSSLSERGERYVNENSQDSLLIVKKKAARIYAKASTESESQKTLMDSDPALQQLWDTIEEYNESIESLECRNRNQLYEMGFRILMLFLALVLVFNMVHSKVKAKKMAKETQKQMNQMMMGGDDTPTL